MKTKSKRLANIELLRVIAMLMVVMLHYLGKGGFLPTITTGMGITDYVAWILESLSIALLSILETYERLILKSLAISH